MQIFYYFVLTEHMKMACEISVKFGKFVREFFREIWHVFKKPHEIWHFPPSIRLVPNDDDANSKVMLLIQVVQTSVAVGVMSPFGPSTKLSIMDQFFLGGPLTLRGFNIKGVGPHEDGSYCPVSVLDLS